MAELIALQADIREIALTEAFQILPDLAVGLELLAAFIDPGEHPVCLARSVARHAGDIGPHDAKVREISVGKRAQLRNGAVIALPTGIP
jgi:hypothetical protein